MLPSPTAVAHVNGWQTRFWNATSATRSSRVNLRPNAIARTVEWFANGPRVARRSHAEGEMPPKRGGSRLVSLTRSGEAPGRAVDRIERQSVAPARGPHRRRRYWRSCLALPPASPNAHLPPLPPSPPRQGSKRTRPRRGPEGWRRQIDPAVALSRTRPASPRRCRGRCSRSFPGS